MKSPFVIQYKATLEKRYKDISNKRILSEFAYRFRKLHADNINLVNDSKLSVKNEIISDFNLNFNYWRGIGNAEIEIVDLEKNDSRLINYRFDITRIFMGYVLLYLFMLISIITLDFSLGQMIDVLVFPGGILVLIIIIGFSIVLIRHKTVFNGVIETIKFGLG